ncbi:hypothetical protein [Tessaracoccus sp.]
MNVSTPAQPGQRAALIAGRTFDILWYIGAAFLIIITLSAYAAASATDVTVAPAVATTAPAFGHFGTTTGSGGSTTVSGGNLTSTFTGSGGSTTTR